MNKSPIPAVSFSAESVIRRMQSGKPEMQMVTFYTGSLHHESLQEQIRDAHRITKTVIAVLDRNCEEVFEKVRDRCPSEGHIYDYKPNDGHYKPRKFKQ